MNKSLLSIIAILAALSFVFVTTACDLPSPDYSEDIPLPDIPTPPSEEPGDDTVQKEEDLQEKPVNILEPVAGKTLECDGFKYVIGESREDYKLIKITWNMDDDSYTLASLSNPASPAIVFTPASDGTLTSGNLTITLVDDDTIRLAGDLAEVDYNVTTGS